MMQIKNLLISSLKPYPNNAKIHTKQQIERVASSINEFGFIQPVVVDKDNTVIIGHCRVLAAKKIKLKSVPTVKLDSLTAEQANALRLIDNKLNESKWDYEMLEQELNLMSLDLSKYGLNDTTLDDDDLLWQIEEEAKIAEERAKQNKFFVLVQCKNEEEMLKAKKEIEQLDYICDTKIK